MDKCGIYKITNIQNNKSYIGKSKHIELRWKQHKTEPFNPNSDAYNTLFYRAIRKYGIENFKFEILEECPEDKLNEKEKYWIQYYNTYILNPNNCGYNMTIGGEYTVNQLKYDINLIQQLWDEGKTQAEIIEIIGCKSNILTRYLDYLNIPVNERRRRGSLYKAKSIIQLSLDDKIINIFSSMSEAVRSLKITNPKAHTSNISYACNGKLKSAYGYKWKFNE